MIHRYKDAQVSLFPVELSLEVEVQLKYPSIKGRTETPISFRVSRLLPRPAFLPDALTACDCIPTPYQQW